MTDTAPPLSVPDDHAAGLTAGGPARARSARRIAVPVKGAENPLALSVAGDFS